MNQQAKNKHTIIKYRIERSKDTVHEADSIKNNQLFAAVNRIYYSIYYMISAIALQDGFSTSKHKQLIGWFNKNYLKTNRLDPKLGEIIKVAYNNRTKSDYEDLIYFTKDDVETMFNDMNILLLELEKLIKLEN